MNATKQQNKQVENLLFKTWVWPKYLFYKRYVLPCCGTHLKQRPVIQNPGENVTMVLCPDGCGYFYLEQFN